jgi:Phage integrase family
MRASYRDRASAANRSERGTGSVRERSPGVWGVRVVVGFDPGRGRSIQRSFTVHGDAALAGRARRELVAEYGSIRSEVRCTASVVTAGELLEGYLGSAQPWKPATITSHRHVVSALLNDPLCRCRLQALMPAVMRAAICRWRDCSAGVLGSTKSGRTRRVTLGSGTADMIRRHFQSWAARTEPEGDWLFRASPRRSGYLTAGTLSRRLTGLGMAAGVEHSGLHRLRHGVATYLDHGRLLKAQARLGHRDPATTLRHYSHAAPLDDTDVADELDRLLNDLARSTDHGE